MDTEPPTATLVVSVWLEEGSAPGRFRGRVRRCYDVLGPTDSVPCSSPSMVLHEVERWLAAVVGTAVADAASVADDAGTDTARTDDPGTGTAWPASPGTGSDD